jgi:hypothetical protein
MITAQIAIIGKLRASEAIQTALGFTVETPGNVFEEQNFDIVDISYPRIQVGNSGEAPLAPRQQQVSASNGKRRNTVYFNIHIFSNKSTSLEAGTIDQLIREELDGCQINNESVTINLCEFESFVSGDRDAETGIWHIVTRYKLIAKVK